MKMLFIPCLAVCLFLSCKKKNGELATLTTLPVTNITAFTASSGGDLTDDGGADITERGICYSTHANPTTSDNKLVGGFGLGIIKATMKGLSPVTTYYVRAYATSSVGTAYGNEVSFVTSDYVTIGTQNWMIKNLDVNNYRNGDPIPKVTDPTAWASLTTGAYCYYNNDSATYAVTYGKLYNWYAVNDPRGLAPAGWHLPSDGEWNKLVKSIDPTADTSGIALQSATAGGAMKDTGTMRWRSPNPGATNSSGFTGLPGASRDGTGAFSPIRDGGLWWSATPANSSNAWYRYLTYNITNFYRVNFIKVAGFSARCVKD